MHYDQNADHFLFKKGLKVPEPLRKYIPGAPEFIEYTKELPKDTTSQKGKAKPDKPSKAQIGAGSGAGAGATTEKMAGLKV